MATHGFFSHGSGQVCSSEFVVLKPETRNLQTDLVLRSLVTFHSSLFRYSLESVPHISAPPRCHHALHGNSLAPGEYRGRWDGPKALFQALRLLPPLCRSNEAPRHTHMQSAHFPAQVRPLAQILLLLDRCISCAPTLTRARDEASRYLARL